MNNELFEIEYTKHHPNDRCTRLPNGNYSGWLKQTSWELWQKSAELMQTAGKDTQHEVVQVQAKPESNAGKWYIRDLRDKATGDFAKFWYQSGYGCNAGQFFSFESKEAVLKRIGGCVWYEPWYAPYVDSLGVKAVPKESFSRDDEARMIEADGVSK